MLSSVEPSVATIIYLNLKITLRILAIRLIFAIRLQPGFCNAHTVLTMRLSNTPHKVLRENRKQTGTSKTLDSISQNTPHFKNTE